MLFRHLAPTAVSVTVGDLSAGLSAISDPRGALRRFRSALTEHTGSDNCYLVSTGRAALALILLGLKRLSGRTRVVIPAYACPTVVQAVLRAGLQPVFCDVSPQTLDLDRETLGRLIGRDLLAVLSVHLYGWAQDARELLSLGREYGFFVVEDAAQAFGATLGGRMVGNWGDAGFYSLGRGKCLPVGHGGVIVSRERCGPAIAEVVREWVSDPARLDIGALALLSGYGVATHPVGWWFVVRTPLNPANDRMDVEALPSIDLGGLSAVQAGIGASMLARLGRIQSVCRHNARRLMAQLAELDSVAVPEIAPDAEPVFLRLPVVVQDQERANRLFELLSREGIGVGRSYRRTMPDLFPNVFPSDGEDFPGAARLATCLLTLPTHAYLREEDFARISRVFAAVDSWEGNGHASTTAR
jgi:perosamine synthetase